MTASRASVARQLGHSWMSELNRLGIKDYELQRKINSSEGMSYQASS